ncbi:DUF1877 family protein [Kitasatospora sp. CB02891]|uniref:DUF1877 family protein n=1 Tax=Kitasatospora sp. CB02891 TaxID=2020329 RepID=UPI000C275A5A|nr:DUF1877 family protein [Kitasatospora sp. CB02891]PJN22078.1 hypothetical protein CG736_30160 [Kitasatospora sp. CB02891]
MPGTSILGSFLRLSAADLARAVERPGWGEEFRDGLAEREELRAPSERRLHETGPAWDESAVLLGRRDLPADLVHGDRPLPGAEGWGYGPPRLLTPEQVAAVERRLADLPFDVLAADLDPHALGGDDPHALDHLAAEYAAPRTFLARTARYRHGLLIRYA